MTQSAVISSFVQYIEGCSQSCSMQRQHLSGAGAVHLLEEKLKQFYEKKYAIAFSNATVALQALCLAMNLKGSEIITSPVNWGGSIAPFLLHKNKLRFTSVDLSSLNLEANDLPTTITPKTRAVLSVDYNGIPSDSEAIKIFCQQNGLLYISDSAQSMGAYRNGKPAGHFADVIVLSFSPGKSLFAGEGGAVITDDEDLYDKLIWFSQHPAKQKTIFGPTNYNEYAPLNGRMNPFSAIFLNESFEFLLEKLKQYQDICFDSITLLLQANLIEPITTIKNPGESTFFNFSVRLTPEISLRQVNEFIRSNNLPFVAVPHVIKFIPCDSQFRKQYKNKFSCSPRLQAQAKEGFFKRRVSFISTPE